MKKILIITDNLPSQINGVVTTYKNLEKYAKLENYQIVYIDPNSFYYFDCPKYKEIKLSLPFTIGKKIKEINPDHIHIATEGPIGIFAKIYLDFFGYSYNTAYHTKFPEAVKKMLGIPENITWAFLRWFHKHTGRVLTTTNSMVDELKTHKFNSEIISWTRGVDRNIFKPSFKNNNEKIKMVCVSRISKEKNLEDFFKLEIPNSEKIMVGDGPMLNKYKEKYTNVKFVGYKTGEDLAEFYRQADVFVFPSRWETFGIVMIEAMACGTPVSAYPCQGPNDVVDHNTGYLDDDLKSAVEKALNLSRKEVYQGSLKWSWEKTWEIFKKNLK